MIFALLLFLFFISLGAFVASILGYGGSVCLVLGGVSIAYLLGCLHEFAHALACKLTKSKIVKISLFALEYEKGKWRISNTLLPFRVCFLTGKNNAFVYLFGIAFSVLTLTAFLTAYLLCHAVWLLPPAIVCVGLVACNLLGKHSDLGNAIQSFRRRK